jgi:alkanesulfonate monooxygenase SsuD/methylene tetrahydromethanopterin reductase-like flavin-dependent oxidoreductase (luciferase family)
MRLGAFTVVEAYGDRPSAADRLLEVVRLARTAEAAGLSSLWVAEHHFHPAGVCPSPPVLLAACGEATRTLRLGSLVSVLPFHRPVDVAEEYAMLDRLLGGRLNFGVGSGYIPLEFEGFGLDPATKRERFESTLDLVLAAFGGREARLAGPEAPPVRLNVLPVQRPHPPVWVAVQRREAIPHVARQGRSIALIPYATVADRAELAEEIAEYRAHLPPGRSGEVAVAMHIYAGDRPDRARGALTRYLESRLKTQSTFYQKKAERSPHAASAEGIERSGFAAIGSADSVADQLSELASIGVDELLGIFDFGGLEEADVARSVASAGAAWNRRLPAAAGATRVPPAAPGSNGI